MLILGILKDILNIFKYWAEIKKIFAFFRRCGLFSPLVVFFLIFIGASGFFFFKKINVVDNRIYDDEVKYTKINELVNNILLECGDKTGISISTISLNIQEDGIFHEGRFKIVKACDKRIKECVVDLIAVKEQELKAPYDIDPVSYNRLLRIGSGVGFPKAISLRKDGVQNLILLKRSPSLEEILRRAAPVWHAEGILNTIYITTILKNDNVLWVLTLLTATDNLSCPNPHQNLYELKEALKNGS